MAHRPELQSPVRALAHRYAAGRMSWADYREQRAAVLADILDGREPLSYGPAEVFDDSTAPKEHELSQVLINLDEIEGTAAPKWPAVAAVLALGLVIVVAGWAVWQSLKPPVTASAPVVEMSPAEGALHRFLTVGEWDEQAIDGALAEWSARSAEERAAARRTATWRRLQQALREQTNQQRVLASVDESGEAAAAVERLERFQQRLSRP